MAEHTKSSHGAGDRTEPGRPSEIGDEAQVSEPSRGDGAGDAVNAVRGLVEQVLEDGLKRVKGEGGKLGGRASQTLGGVLSELGVAQRRDHEDLELRIAQLEHRIRLLEEQADARGDTTASGADEPSPTDS